MATQTQLIEAGLTDFRGEPSAPWHRIRGGGSDASTMWYAVFRKRVRGVFIGDLCFRQAPRYASLKERGWEEVAPEDIGV